MADYYRQAPFFRSSAEDVLRDIVVGGEPDVLSIRRRSEITLQCPPSGTVLDYRERSELESGRRWTRWSSGRVAWRRPASVSCAIE
ncbi:hypothetical protein EVAR_42501_1 [Eumeta japonica]|uniref:Uncharacterized protein n=1 Tax=Eumeta variegata TaxID=151549 RepID=A0A4C1XI63_EUMVA|nr:hypothetical protein EVAR_42501_1 [Eumeta japonica]